MVGRVQRNHLLASSVWCCSWLTAISAAAMVIYRPNRDVLQNLVREEQMRVATGGNVG